MMGVRREKCEKDSADKVGILQSNFQKLYVTRLTKTENSFLRHSFTKAPRPKRLTGCLMMKSNPLRALENSASHHCIPSQ